MEKHSKHHDHECEHDEHCNHEHNHSKTTVFNIIFRWLLCLLIVIISLVLLRPYIVKQLKSRAVSYEASRIYGDAIRIYKKILFFDKNNLDAWKMLGYDSEKNNDIDFALTCYKKALELDPKNKDAHVNLGLIFMEKKDYKDAVIHFEYIRSLGPEKKVGFKLDILGYHKTALKSLVTCYDALKETDKKNACLKELLRFYPEEKEARL